MLYIKALNTLSSNHAEELFNLEHTTYNLKFKVK